MNERSNRKVIKTYEVIILHRPSRTFPSNKGTFRDIWSVEIHLNMGNKFPSHQSPYSNEENYVDIRWLNDRSIISRIFLNAFETNSYIRESIEKPED